MTKSTYQEERSQPKNDGFPKLMKHKRTGTIALFRDPYNCTCLVPKSTTDCAIPFAHQTNRYNGGNNPESWEPFYGSVTVTSTKD